MYTFCCFAAKSLQLCPTLCDPIDGSPPGSPIPGILQARTLEWVAISFSNAWKWEVKVKSLSRVRLLVTPWIAAYQASPSMGFSRQEYWSWVPLPFLTISGNPANESWHHYHHHLFPTSPPSSSWRMAGKRALGWELGKQSGCHRQSSVCMAGFLGIGFASFCFALQQSFACYPFITIPETVGPRLSGRTKSDTTEAT